MTTFSLAPASLAARLPDVATAARFVSVGIINTLVYAVVTMIAVSLCDATPAVGSMIGFASALPLAYFAHRRVTFRSDGAVGAELPRFIITYGTGFLVSYIAMRGVTTGLGLHYVVGVLSVCVLVPAANFLVLDRWVFAARKG